MNVRIKLSCVSLACAAFLLVAAPGYVKAQGGPGGPPPGGGFRGAGPMGPDDALGFVGFEGAFSGKTVTGAPFTAEFSTESTETLSDGNTIDNKTTGSFARDSQGRTRRELTLPAISGYSTSGNSGGPAHGIVINDPVAGASYILNENRKTARKSTLPTGGFRGGNRGPNADNRPNSANVATQDLGTQMIGGIAADCTVTTRTIPAGRIGNAKAIALSTERCYSSDLQTNVLIKRSDPRGGTTVFQLTNVVRGEPDVSLFQVPSDYTVVAGGRGPGGRRGPRAGGNPPPPPAQ